MKGFDYFCLGWVLDENSTIIKLIPKSNTNSVNMRFNIKLKLHSDSQNLLPINYQYPLSAAIYKILDKGDAEYAKFLHEEGYGKGYKFFTFSDLKLKFKLNGDRMVILDSAVEFVVCFHLPEASKTFVEGLFRSQEIVIADKKSRATFYIESIVSMQNPLKNIEDRALVKIATKPISMVVTGSKNEKGNYDFRMPDEAEFVVNLIYGWRNKIREAFDDEAAENAILMIEVEFFKRPYRSRLAHIKSGLTKIRGSVNYKLHLTAEKRFLDLILNSGIGLYTAQGMGCLEVVE